MQTLINKCNLYLLTCLQSLKRSKQKSKQAKSVYMTKESKKQENVWQGWLRAEAIGNLQKYVGKWLAFSIHLQGIESPKLVLFHSRITSLFFCMFHYLQTYSYLIMEI